MTTLDRNEIWAQAFELGQLILDSPEVNKFKEAEFAMEQHPEIKPKLRQFRDLQEQYERLSEHGTGSHLDALRGDVNKLSDELDAFPEVQAYKQAMAEVDELLKAVTALIANTIAEKQ
ncbi:MAG TPA: YlbF family regulator [Bacilli bacterium]|nr:YlbF family regulator [Bacilli bacterium]